jgi:hypothetical protein
MERIKTKLKPHEAVARLGEDYFDEALVIAKDDRDAAFLASACLVKSIDTGEVQEILDLRRGHPPAPFEDGRGHA